MDTTPERALVDQLLLAGAQGLALAAAIQPVERGRIAFFECRHGPRVSGVGRAGPDVRYAKNAQIAKDVAMPTPMFIGTPIFRKSAKR